MAQLVEAFPVLRRRLGLDPRGGLDQDLVRASLARLAVDGMEPKGWDWHRIAVAALQLEASEVGAYPLRGVDGLVGPQTRHALEVLTHVTMGGADPRDFRGSGDVPQPGSTTKPAGQRPWPRQAGVQSFYGEPGGSQVVLDLPYPMRLAWELKTEVHRISCHSKVRDSLERIFQGTLDAYGHQRISELRLDLFGGCLNVRRIRGGTGMSMHSWGIAVDIDPDNNQLRWGRERASLARPEYDAFWAIVEGEGWTSLGRTKNYDWMHFQAASL